MRIERIDNIEGQASSDAAGPWRLVRHRVTAPHHPLADADGRVPAEVFEVPPELLSVIRTAPIRSTVAPADPPAVGPSGPLQTSSSRIDLYL